MCLGGVLKQPRLQVLEGLVRLPHPSHAGMLVALCFVSVALKGPKRD